MDHKEIINYFRVNGLLKGTKPAIVKLRKNKASKYHDVNGNYIMSIKGNVLYFQKLSVVFKKPMPNLDFQVNLLNFNNYQLVSLNKLVNCLFISHKKEGFLEIFYNLGTNETYITKDNILRTINEFKKLGLTEIKYGDEDGQAVDDETEGTN